MLPLMKHWETQILKYNLFSSSSQKPEKKEIYHKPAQSSLAKQGTERHKFLSQRKQQIMVARCVALGIARKF